MHALRCITVIKCKKIATSIKEVIQFPPIRLSQDCAVLDTLISYYTKSTLCTFKFAHTNTHAQHTTQHEAHMVYMYIVFLT